MRALNNVARRAGTVQRCVSNGRKHSDQHSVRTRPRMVYLAALQGAFMSFLLALDQIPANGIQIGGGKATNLGVVLRAGLTVPDGFCITTDAYRAFVGAADGSLEAAIHEALRSNGPDDLEGLARASS